jgi:hypothetical protein
MKRSTQGGIKVRCMKSVFRIGAALGIAIVTATALAVPASASVSASVSAPAAVKPAATHRGNWKIGHTVDGATHETRKVNTRNNVSACVTANHLTGAWHFQLIWFNGGRNTVLYSSRPFSHPGIHCTPTEVIKHGKKAQVYLKISVTGVNSAGSGNFEITTN